MIPTMKNVLDFLASLILIGWIVFLAGVFIAAIRAMPWAAAVVAGGIAATWALWHLNSRGR